MWRQLPCNRVIGSRCRVKDSSARSFASEETNEKREGGRTTLTSAKEEGGEGREGGEDVTAAELAAVVAVGIRVCVALYK